MEFGPGTQWKSRMDSRGFCFWVSNFETMLAHKFSNSNSSDKSVWWTNDFPALSSSTNIPYSRYSSIGKHKRPRMVIVNWAVEGRATNLHHLCNFHDHSIHLKINVILLSRSLRKQYLTKKCIHQVILY